MPSALGHRPAWIGTVMNHLMRSPWNRVDCGNGDACLGILGNGRHRQIASGASPDEQDQQATTLASTGAEIENIGERLLVAL